MKRFVSLDPLQWGTTVTSLEHGHQNSTGNLNAHRSCCIRSWGTMQSNIVRQLIWHQQIKLQMYRLSTWCQDDGVSLGCLLCQVFQHRRLELRDGGDLHLLWGGVLAFDGLQERQRFGWETPKTASRHLKTTAVGAPTRCLVCPSVTFTTFLAMCAITGIKLSAVYSM